MPAFPNLTFTVAHPPNNFITDNNGWIDFLNGNNQIVIPNDANILLGGSGTVLPITDIGPFLLLPQRFWYVWDPVAQVYIAQANADFIGVVFAFAYGSGSPSVDSTRWVKCDGRGIPRAAPYNQLYAKIGTTYGTGDGSTTFNVPNIADLETVDNKDIVYYIRYA